MRKLGVYLINLDRSKERLAAMRKKLLEAGFGGFTRVQAVDGFGRAPSFGEINENAYRIAHGKKGILPGEYGCYMSHVKAIRAFIESDNDYALILEDDMAFDDDFRDVIEALTACSCWDIVKLNGGHGGGNLPVMRVGSRRLVLNAFYQSKSGAYIINRRAGAAYLRCLLPMFVPYDHEFIKFWKYCVRGFSMHPFPAREEGIDVSTVQHVRNRGLFMHRITMAGYKLYITLRRLGHAVWRSVSFYY